MLMLLAVERYYWNYLRIIDQKTIAIAFRRFISTVPYNFEILKNFDLPAYEYCDVMKYMHHFTPLRVYVLMLERKSRMINEAWMSSCYEAFSYLIYLAHLKACPPHGQRTFK